MQVVQLVLPVEAQYVPSSHTKPPEHVAARARGGRREKRRRRSSPCIVDKQSPKDPRPMSMDDGECSGGASSDVGAGRVPVRGAGEDEHTQHALEHERTRKALTLPYTSSN